MAKLIMVVENEVDLRELLIMAMEEEGIFNVIGTGNGRVALNLLKTTTVDLITLDMHMPEMDGNSFLAELAIVAPSIPVVVISGTPHILGEHSQVKASLSKPFEINKLLRTLETYCA